MINEKAADVINIIRERIDGELIHIEDYDFYIWYISGEKVPKKVLTLCFHTCLDHSYWSVTADGSEHDYVRMHVPHNDGTAKDIAEQILSAWW